MKKLLVLCALGTIFSAAAYAETTLDKTAPRPQMSEEKQAEMHKFREAVENLGIKQKLEFKKEMERHRAEVKRITGLDLPDLGPGAKMKKDDRREMPEKDAKE